MTQPNFDNAKAEPFVSSIDLDNVTAGATFKATWGFTNTGTTTWDGRYQFLYTITPHPETAAYPRSPMATQSAFPITALGAPAAVRPGETIQLTLTFTAPTAAATHATNWQLQAPDGTRFGPVRWMRAVVKEVKTTERGNQTTDFTPETWRSAIWDITSVFESGRPGGRVNAYQNGDGGIVSYGKHQSTLQSGNLERVLNAYFQRSSSTTSQALQQEYATRVNNKEESLRHDVRFKELLLAAAEEEAMRQAQDAHFEQNFYQPTTARASELGVKTPLGLACLYDARVQGGLGGLNRLLELVTQKLGSPGPSDSADEPTWIRVFLDEREAWLRRVADNKEQEGKAQDAQYLRNSTFRVTELRRLLDSGNLDLAGEFSVRGQLIRGHVPGREKGETAVPAPPRPMPVAPPDRYHGPAVTFAAGIHGPGDAHTWHDAGFQNMVSKLDLPVKFMSDGDRFKWYQKFHKPQLNLVRAFWKPDPNRRKTARQAWEEDIRDGVLNFYKSGARNFEVHNEPRLHHEGMGHQWKNGEEFGDFLRELMLIIQQACPDVRLWYPGESPGVPWTDQFAFTLPAYKKVSDLCYGLCQHAYSGNTTVVETAVAEIVDQVRDFHKVMGVWNKPIIVSECSVNRAATTEFRAKVYAKAALEMSKIPGVQGVFWYISHWNPPPNEKANAESWYGTDLPVRYKRAMPV